MNRFIYTVQPGDNLYDIARRFNVTVEEIKEVNGLVKDEIYEGQQLIIPIMTYVIRQGDNIYDLARLIGVPVESIILLNDLESDRLEIGQELVIPYYVQGTTTKENVNAYQWKSTSAPVLQEFELGTNFSIIDTEADWIEVILYNNTIGYIQREDLKITVFDGSKPIVSILGFYTLEEGPQLPSSFESFVNNTEDLSEVALFFFRLSEENPTEIDRFGEFTDEEVEKLVEIGHRTNIKMMPVLHNLLFGDVEISKRLVGEAVATQESRKRLINNIIALIEKYNFDGINIDIEDVNKEDDYNLSLFYVELGKALNQYNYFYSASIPSRISDKEYNPFSDPFDYGIIGSVVDEFVMMLYNEHGWPGSGPGAVVSIPWMKKVSDYAITKMPREKIMAAVSVFGFDFNLDTGKNAYVTYQTAMDRANKYGAEVMFDELSQTPMFSYVDDEGMKHEVWFENAASIYAKIELAWNLGLKGVALWRLGLEDPAVWTMLSEDVVVRK